MNKTTKKVLISAFALTTALSLAACGNGNKNATGLVVDTNLFSGDFFRGNFSNSSYDADVINLTSATEVIAQDANGRLLINKGIVTDEKVDKTTDADGNTVVTWHIRKDLKWSDGQPITAKDYVFAALFANTPEWAATGANVSISDYVLGLEDYATGKTDRLAGIKLVDDYTLSITILKDHLPYFYEMVYYNIDAAPMHELAKGATISSTDAGSKIEGIDLKTMAENIKKTQVDSRKPTVTYGKYNFEASSETEMVLKLNPNYVGNYEGVKPTVETVTLKANSNGELAVQRLEKGEVDFVPQLVDEALVKAATSNSALQTIKYQRNGYGYLGMANEFGPTADINVRHAIGHLVNRNKLITDVLGGGGIAVNSAYSTAQWMAQEKEAELNSKLDKYSYDIAAANAELDESAYRFEADGVTKFDVSKASENYLRYNANKEPLEIKHLATDNNPVSVALETNLTVDGPKVGMKYTITKTDFTTLSKAIDNTSTASNQQEYHIYNLASNFTGSVVDPYTGGEHSRNLGKRINPYRVNDAQLDKAIETMRSVEPANTDEFANKWLDYIVRYNELLPILPLYSNIYYNASNDKVATDPTTSIRRWSQVMEYFRLK